MNRVVPINRVKRGQLFSAYYDNARTERIPEQVVFVVGGLLSVGLPPFIFGFYGGGIPTIAFAASLSIGLIWGLVKYYLLPVRFLSILGAEPAAQHPPTEDYVLKDAA